jgi:hypothetical protein
MSHACSPPSKLAAPCRISAASAAISDIQVTAHISISASIGVSDGTTRSHAWSHAIAPSTVQHQRSVSFDRRRPCHCSHRQQRQHQSQHQRQCQRRCNARKQIVARNDTKRSAESVQRPLQDSVSPTSRSATHICLAASRAATHSNRTTRIGV